LLRETNHSYEQIREVVVDVLLGKEQTAFEPHQYVNLVSGTAQVLGRRVGAREEGNAPGYEHRLSTSDEELVRDVFWDLFRQGMITLGMNNANPNWPFFRLSHLGKRILASQSPYRFHDTTSYIASIRREVPDVSDEAVIYLEEAAASFYAGCNLAACVMLGVAAEAEFLRLLDVVSAGPRGATFAAVREENFIRAKITKFNEAVRPMLKALRKKDFEDFETNMTLIQSVLRISRNDAGHPSGNPSPDREQVYILLQLFAPFARQVAKLRQALS
jgi:hypothetical protein